MQEISLKQVTSSGSEHPLSFNRLHGVISQKTGLFITTAMRTSNPTLFANLETQKYTMGGCGVLLFSDS
jgi:hypothetical protein